jgi:quercetin dioxygenase-like cupin family protein
MNPEHHRVEFDSMPWESPAPGVRFKKCERQDRQLRLVEFTKEFVETGWCTKGHAGYVLEGAIAVDFHGEDVVFLAGDGLFIPPGSEHRHKARAITDSVTLVLVDEGRM